ncbi:MAG: hypothetical protein JJU41_09470 [Bacteroidetes bacterium]|nr:hypothetical protein [Bacteroidota bacterium]
MANQTRLTQCHPRLAAWTYDLRHGTTTYGTNVPLAAQPYDLWPGRTAYSTELRITA